MANKYYWLKLKRDFFKRHDIRVVEEMPNGKDYILFYLKLLVESVDHEGSLRFNDTIPYNENMLSAVTNTNIDIVRAAMTVFKELELIEVLDDKTIYMTEIQSMLGSETEWAKKKREYRQGQIEDKLRTKKDIVRQEIEKEIELEIEKEIDIDNKESNKLDSSSVRETDYDKIIAMWNELDGLGNIRGIRSITDGSKRRNNTRSRIKQYGLDGFKDAIEQIKDSDFLQGKNRSGWSITYDWFVLPSNFPKVLEGNYRNDNHFGNDINLAELEAKYGD